jgi:hypothetical protein
MIESGTQLVEALMGILIYARRFPRTLLAGLSSVFGGVGWATKPNEVTMQCRQSCGNIRLTKLVAF